MGSWFMTSTSLGQGQPRGRIGPLARAVCVRQLRTGTTGASIVHHVRIAPTTAQMDLRSSHEMKFLILAQMLPQCEVVWWAHRDRLLQRRLHVQPPGLSQPCEVWGSWNSTELKGLPKRHVDLATLESLEIVSCSPKLVYVSSSGDWAEEYGIEVTNSNRAEEGLLFRGFQSCTTMFIVSPFSTCSPTSNTGKQQHKSTAHYRARFHSGPATRTLGLPMALYC
jgi:hypothetical protein